MEDAPHAGPSGKTYALGRREKSHFIFRYKVRARMAVYAAKKYLGADKPFRILDLGAADCLTLLEIRHLLPSGTYVGVEYSEQLLRSVPELPADIRMVEGDIMNLPPEVKDEPYDMVTALAVLEHLGNPLKAVQEAAGVIRPGGIFVATCPDPLWDTLSQRLGLLSDAHEIRIGRKSMIDLVKNSGMELLRYEKFMWAPVALVPYLKIPVSPLFSLSFDRVIGKLRIFDWSFVNQCVIARKPL